VKQTVLRISNRTIFEGKQGKTNCVWNFEIFEKQTKSNEDMQDRTLPQSNTSLEGTQKRKQRYFCPSLSTVKPELTTTSEKRPPVYNVHYSEVPFRSFVT
jgi:hypothetical protein